MQRSRLFSTFFALFSLILISSSSSFGQNLGKKKVARAKAVAVTAPKALKKSSSPVVTSSANAQPSDVDTANLDAPTSAPSSANAGTKAVTRTRREPPKTTTTSSTLSTTFNVAPKLEKVAPESPFSISAALGKSQNLYDFQDGTKAESIDFEMIPAYKSGVGLTRAVVTYSHDPKDSNNSELGDIALLHSFKGWDVDAFKISPGLSGVLPETKKTRVLQGLDASAGVSLSAAIQEKLLVKGFYFKTSVSLSQNFHRYETALDGSVNNKYSSRQSVFSGFAYEPFSFDVEFHHINAWSYQNVLKEAFEHTEELSVEIAKHYGIGLGHTNSGKIFRENATDSNVRLIDERSSIAYAKMSIRF